MFSIKGCCLCYILYLSLLNTLVLYNTIPTVSATEAEYMAMSLASRHLIWLQRGLQLFRGITSTSSSIATASRDLDYLLGNNQGALELAKNPRINSRSKHIDVHYHYIRQQLEDGNFDILYVPTADNLADLLIKSLLICYVSFQLHLFAASAFSSVCLQHQLSASLVCNFSFQLRLSALKLSLHLSTFVFFS